jgi:hypothetical protein
MTAMSKVGDRTVCPRGITAGRAGLADHRGSRGLREHQPPAPQPLWKRLKVRIVAGLGAGMALVFTVVLLPTIKDALSDKVVHQGDTHVIYATATAMPPEDGCVALAKPLDAHDRAAIILGSDFNGIIRSHGGAAVRQLSIDILFQGGSGDATINAIEIQPRLSGKQQALSSALLCHPSSGSAGVPQLTANLDAARPTVRIDGKRYPDAKILTVDPVEQVPVHLTASITQGSVQFDIRVTYTREGKTRTLDVHDADGGPFRLTGAAPAYRELYASGVSTGYRLASAHDMCSWIPTLKGC